MKRLFASFLLCLAMFALPIQGAAAAVMMVCSAAEAAGLSMTERHAAVKAEAEAEIGVDGAQASVHGHCHMQSVSEADDQPVWHDAGDKGRDAGTVLPIGKHASHMGSHAGHHAGGMCSACAACAAGAMLLPEIPTVALIHQRHAAPLAAPAAFASYLPLPAERPPTPLC
ncbi:hypothetical protein [Cupriavidus plantarum]|uniref:Uncharacterized protein n=1 Tax=Cupriavidus plantarum TaxID=942865 RepID=A0A316ETY7_9BURK|nr:hypothetical protein [Cupriavidus plantarum]PWK35202.1 hypothetical protein C7419_102480 [Cupriavidus plantarum]